MRWRIPVSSPAVSYSAGLSFVWSTASQIRHKQRQHPYRHDLCGYDHGVASSGASGKYIQWVTFLFTILVDFIAVQITQLIFPSQLGLQRYPTKHLRSRHTASTSVSSSGSLSLTLIHSLILVASFVLMPEPFHTVFCTSPIARIIFKWIIG